jgi:hypothetical protein
MKSRIEVIKELVKKYPNNYQLGNIIRQYVTEEYWKLPQKVQESKWQKELNKI